MNAGTSSSTSIAALPSSSATAGPRITGTTAALGFEGDCEFGIVENGRPNTLSIAQILARLGEFSAAEQAWVLLQLGLQFKYGGIYPELWERCRAAGAVEQGGAA